MAVPSMADAEGLPVEPSLAYRWGTKGSSDRLFRLGVFTVSGQRRESPTRNQPKHVLLCLRALPEGSRVERLRQRFADKVEREEKKQVAW